MLQTSRIVGGTLNQFGIAKHYDAMAQLDADVHDNTELSDSEVETALRLVCGDPNDPARVPKSVFLPCFGTGRHIEPLLRRGVERVVGVDLSPACVKKARAKFESDKRVTLVVADLGTFNTRERFDAAFLLGNSFGDIVNPYVLGKVTRGMVQPIKPGGMWVMDYIGYGYLGRCNNEKAVSWDAEFNGHPVHDNRVASFSPSTSLMTIRVNATYKDSGVHAWSGAYQKLVMTDAEVREHFMDAGVVIQRLGLATEIVPYYKGYDGELGMLTRSWWWSGVC